jgi:hypothetical protein
MTEEAMLFADALRRDAPTSDAPPRAIVALGWRVKPRARETTEFPSGGADLARSNARFTIRNIRIVIRPPGSASPALGFAMHPTGLATPLTRFAKPPARVAKPVDAFARPRRRIVRPTAGPAKPTLPIAK